MSTEATYATVTSSGAETEALGEKIGGRLRGGEIFELIGDLGAGKTAFVKGLARGLGITTDVTSPTFTINNIYKGDKLTIQHFDFYRLIEAGVMAEELKEAVFDPSNVIAIEWSDVVHNILPKSRVIMHFKMAKDNKRTISCRYPKSLNYIFEGLSS